MKKVLILMVFAGFGMSASAQSNVVKVNILSLVVSTINVQYEHVLTSESSVQLGFAYTGASIGETQLRGIQITPEYRFYLSDTDAPDGFYAAPYLRYSNLSLSEDNSNAEADLSSFGGGLVVGHQWIFKERFSLETFLGPSYAVSSFDVKSGNDEDTFEVGTFDGFGIRFGVCFGIAF